MFKRIFTIVLFLLVLALIACSLAFSSQRLSRVKCNELTVIIPSESTRFIDEEEVARLVKEAEPKLIGKRLDYINTNLLEQTLQKYPAIKNAEVFRYISGDRLDFKGQLVVEVTQRDPLFRVMNEKADYYVDEKGVRIPANPKFAARVILVTGEPSVKTTVDELVPLVSFICNDPFWKTQIKQIDIDQQNELTMVPLVGDQLIEFGDARNYSEKFRNLKALYDQAMPVAGWDKYSKISLKYKNQVVCTRKGEPLVQAAAPDAVTAAPITAATEAAKPEQKAAAKPAATKPAAKPAAKAPAKTTAKAPAKKKTTTGTKKK